MKKVLFLSLSLLCSAITTTQYCAVQEKQVSTDAKTNEVLTQDEIQKSINMLQDGYAQAKSLYDTKLMDNYEVLLEKAISDYILKSAKDAEALKDLSAIETICVQLVKELEAKSNKDQAYAVAGMMFTLAILKSFEDIEETIKDQAQLKNLTQASEELNSFTEKFFLSNIQQLA